MLKAHCSALLFAFFTALSFSAAAVDPVATTGKAEVASVQEKTVAKVNLNTADAGTLESELIGIGKVKAHAIVEHRDTNGPFASVDELLEVKGIGAATLEKNRERLSVN